MSFTDPEGDVIVSDGTHIWIYYPSTDARQVGAHRRVSAGLRASISRRSSWAIRSSVSMRRSLAARRCRSVRASGPAWSRAKSMPATVNSKFGSTVRTGWLAGSRSRKTAGWPPDRAPGPEDHGSLSDDLFRFTPPPGARVVDRGADRRWRGRRGADAGSRAPFPAFVDAPFVVSPSQAPGILPGLLSSCEVAPRRKYRSMLDGRTGCGGSAMGTIESGGARSNTASARLYQRALERFPAA